MLFLHPLKDFPAASRCGSQPAYNSLRSPIFRLCAHASAAGPAIATMIALTNDEHPSTYWHPVHVLRIWSPILSSGNPHTEGQSCAAKCNLRFSSVWGTVSHRTETLPHPPSVAISGKILNICTQDSNPQEAPVPGPEANHRQGMHQSCRHVSTFSW